MNISKCMCAVVIALSSTIAMAAGSLDFELFSTSLKNFKRDQLRQIIAKKNVKPLRVSDDYWADIYETREDRDGIYKISMLYSSEEDFAAVTYTFPSAATNIALAKRLDDQVRAKYGQPTSIKGGHTQVPLIVSWVLPEGMQISLTRGWPVTIIQLSLEDSVIRAKTAQQRAATRQ